MVFQWNCKTRKFTFRWIRGSFVAWILSRQLNERSNKEIQLSKVPTTRVPCPFSVLLAELIVSGRNLVCIRGFKRRNKLSCRGSLPLLTIQEYLLRFFFFLDTWMDSLSIWRKWTEESLIRSLVRGSFGIIWKKMNKNLIQKFWSLYSTRILQHPL